jgi:hypothetical protein
VPAIVTDNRLSITMISTVALWIGGFPVLVFKLDELGHDRAEQHNRHHHWPDCLKGYFADTSIV